MKDKKVTPFQFKKISRKEIEKSTAPKAENEAKVHSAPKKVKTAKELVQKIGDKEKLSTEEKFEVIDFVFNKNKQPIIICHICGAKIQSKYYISHSKSKDLIICPGCVQSLDPCDNCGLPTKVQGIKLPTIYCPFCKVNRECDCCGKSITAKESHRIPYLKGSFCQDCINSSNYCIVCDHPLYKNEGQSIGGKKVCHSCSQRVVKADQAQTIVLTLNKLISKYFSVKLNAFSTELVAFDQIKQKEISIILHQMMIINNKQVLWLYEGLSKERLIGIVCYEYGNLLLKELNTKIRDKAFQDAFSLWLKAFILNELGELDEVLMIKGLQKSTPILKTLFNIERLGGLDRIIDKIKNHEIG